MRHGVTVEQPVREELGEGLERRSGALAFTESPGSPLAPHGPLSFGSKASRFRVFTMAWEEGVASRIEAEHRDLDGIQLSSWACCLVVGNTVLISKGHSCVALMKLADHAGLQVVEGGIG